MSCLWLHSIIGLAWKPQELCLYNYNWFSIILRKWLTIDIYQVINSFNHLADHQLGAVIPALPALCSKSASSVYFEDSTTSPLNCWDMFLMCIRIYNPLIILIPRGVNRPTFPSYAQANILNYSIQTLYRHGFVMEFIHGGLVPIPR